MTRHAFGGSVADYTVAAGGQVTVNGITGNELLLMPGIQVTFWDSASAGNQITDLLDATGTAVTYVTTDAYGSIPQFQGPDTSTETWHMWADGNGGSGPRRIIVATDLGDTVNANKQSLLDVTNTVDSLQTLNASSLGVVEYDSVNNAWPTRPTDSRIYMWVGSTAPPVGGGYMQDGRDFWLNPNPVA